MLASTQSSSEYYSHEKRSKKSDKKVQDTKLKLVACTIRFDFLTSEKYLLFLIHQYFYSTLQYYKTSFLI